MLRQQYFAKGLKKASLDAIEKVSHVCCLSGPVLFGTVLLLLQQIHGSSKRKICVRIVVVKL